MKSQLQHWLERRWYAGAPPGLVLRLLAGLYQVLGEWRSALYRNDVLHTHRFSVPVLVIGNFTAGGTGKTPLTIAIARYFQTLGLHPGIVSRGYGRRSAVPVRVAANTPVELCGDEPKLIFERTRLPVFVDSNRVRATRAAIGAGCDLVIADDGLQHHRLGRDLEIEVLDGERRYGNGLLLPAGPLRELPRECDFRVVNGGVPEAGEWPMQLRLSDAVSLFDSRQRCPLSEFAGAPVHAIAGIGHPERFFDALAAAGLNVIDHAFGDHHDFRVEDFAGLEGVLLMTEKDAVKCRSLGLRQAWVVPVEAELPAEFFQAIERKLKQRHA